MRIEKNDSLFFIDKIPIVKDDPYTIVKRKNLIGLDLENEEIIPPVFDDISIFSGNIAKVVINDSIALFNINEKKFITEMFYDAVELDNDYIILKTGMDKMSIYDIQNYSFLFEGEYELANIKDRSTEYVWVKRGNFYDFIRRKDGSLIRMPGIIMAYDTEEGMYGMDENHKVSCFDERGIEDIEKFRNKIIKSGGYLRLQNHTYNTEDIIDVYGNKIN